jgi:hypothetical protein
METLTVKPPENPIGQTAPKSTLLIGCLIRLSVQKYPAGQQDKTTHFHSPAEKTDEYLLTRLHLTMAQLATPPHGYSAVVTSAVQPTTELPYTITSGGNAYTLRRDNISIHVRHYCVCTALSVTHTIFTIGTQRLQAFLLWACPTLDPTARRRPHACY